MPRRSCGDGDVLCVHPLHRPSCAASAHHGRGHDLDDHEPRPGNLAHHSASQWRRRLRLGGPPGPPFSLMKDRSSMVATWGSTRKTSPCLMSVGGSWCTASCERGISTGGGSMSGSVIVSHTSVGILHGSEHHAHRPQVIRPCSLSATGVLFHIVDCTGLAQDLLSNISPPGMWWE